MIEHSSPIVIVTGLSGAGKTTLVERLVAKGSIPLIKFVTTTTRAPRPGEKDGVHYWFVSSNEFERGIQENRFFEWARVYGNHYGMDRHYLADLEQTGKTVVFVVDPQGAKTLQGIFPNAKTIFIDASREDLARRLTERRMKPEDMEKRLGQIEVESAFKERSNVVILNTDGKMQESLAALERAVAETQKN